MLHGALGSSSQLDPLKKILESSGYDVLTLNFSSHGGMPPSASGFGIDVFARETEQFIVQRNQGPVAIFGYSMGGYVALWLALKQPELVESIMTLGTKFDWSPESAEKEIRKLNPEKILEKVPVFARALETRHQPHDWKHLMRATAAMMQGLGDNPLLTRGQLSSISTRTLVALGDTDDMVDLPYSRQVADWLPNGRFELLPQTPHLLENTNLNQLAGVLKTFFA